MNLLPGCSTFVPLGVATWLVSRSLRTSWGRESPPGHQGQLGKAGAPRPGYGGQVSPEQSLGMGNEPRTGSLSCPGGGAGPWAVPTGRNDQSAVRFALL